MPAPIPIPRASPRGAASCRAIVLTIVASAALAGNALAYEGHAALPSSGAKVEGNRILVSPEARRALGVTTVEVGSGSVSRMVTANASLAVPWTSRGFASSLVGGRVVEVLTRPGDDVAAGDESVRLESSDLVSVQFEFLQAASERSLAETLVAQRRELTESGVVATKELAAAGTDLASRRAAEAIARRKLRALGLDDATIDALPKSGEPNGRVSLLSPLAGRVAWLDARIGGVIDPLTHVAEVVEPGSLWAVVELPEAALRDVKIGQRVDSLIGGRADDLAPTARGIVAGFSPAVAEGRWVSLTIVPLDEPAESLRAGMFGRVRIRAAEAPDGATAPSATINDLATRPFVLVEEEAGVYLKTNVALGLREGETVQILDGVYPGDRVVLRGGHELAAMFPRTEPPPRVAPAGAVPRSSGRETVDAPGKLEASVESQALAAAKSSGRIKRLMVMPGDLVERGRPLAEVESLDLKTLQLDLAQAVVKAALARRELDRIGGLDEQGLAVQRRVWQARAELTARTNEVETGRRRLQLAGLDAAEVERLADVDPLRSDAPVAWTETLVVRSPIAGRVAPAPETGDLALGHVVRPDQPLVSVVDLSRMWVRAGVPADAASRVVVGASATVRLTADPEFRVEGRVVRVSPTLDPDDRQLDVWIETANPDERLRIGMLADAEIELAPRAPSSARTAEDISSAGGRP